MMKNVFRNFISLLLIFLITVPSVAFADAASAQVFYENAAKEYQKGNYGVAAELLYKAYVNDANLIYAYNRILALQADKQYKEALKELNVFENQMMKDPDKRFEDVPEIKSKLEDQVKAAESAKVTDVKKDPDVKDPDVKDPDVKDPDVKDPDIVEPAPESGLNAIEILGLTIAGAGVPVLGVGILFGSGITLSEEGQEYLALDSDKKNLTTQREIYSADGLGCDIKGILNITCVEIDKKIADDKAIRDRDIPLGWTLVGIGSAMIIGGGITYLVSGDSPSESADATNFQFSPYITPTGAGAGFSLDF